MNPKKGYRKFWEEDEAEKSKLLKKSMKLNWNFHGSG